MANEKLLERIQITLPQLKRLCAAIKDIVEHNGIDALVAYEVYDDGSVGINLHGVRAAWVTGLEHMNLHLDE